MKASSTLRRPARSSHEVALQRVLDVVARSLAALDTKELTVLRARLEHNLQPRDIPADAARFVRDLAGADHARTKQIELEQRALVEHARRRAELLQGFLTTTQVAALLGTTRQTPYDRAKSGSLLALKDRGILRFPPWQFDAASDDGVVTGIPEVSRALRISPLAKVSWMVHPNAFLENDTPLERLRSGQVDEVVQLARGVERA